MIGQLPNALEVDGKEYPINSDFRVALLIFEAYNDPELNELEKCEVCLECLYRSVPQNAQKALEQATWFLDGGDMPKSKKAPKRLIDWEYDQHMIFPAVNKVAGCETRLADYIHWWTFLGYFNEAGDGLFSQVINIRSKLAKGKTIDKAEREFYNEHREMVDIKEKLTEQELAEQKAEQDFVDSLFE